VPPDRGTAEKAHRAATALLQQRDTHDPPRPGVYVGEYSRRHNACAWEAKAAAHRALTRGLLRLGWRDSHTRLTPTNNSNDTEGGGGAHARQPRDPEPVSIDALERDAPRLAAALLQTHHDTEVYSQPERFVDCARLWDATALMERHGVDATTAHAHSDLVVCRECGRPAGGDARPHLADSHDTTASTYSDSHPAAPLTTQEAGALPPADIRWR
jgi:hypothetical protein